MPRRTVLIALGAFVAIAAILWIPWAGKQRVVVASTPVPPAQFAVKPVPLAPGSTACLQQVTLDPKSQIVEIGVATGGRPGPPLEISASGPGYSATAHVPAGYTDNPALHFGLTPPHRSLLGQVCVKNQGKRPITLNGTDEFRTLGRPSLVIDGAGQPYDMHLAFFANKQQSYLGMATDIFRHAAAFTPPFLPWWVLMLLAFVAVLGIPAGAFAALATALRYDDD